MEFLPFALQGLLMGVDEFYCHRHRKLRRWERLGHPLDTLSFLLCLLFLLFIVPSQMALYVYGALSVFSCLLITKDEWQHQELCSGFENWLHAVLFILHPVILIWAGYLWWSGSSHFFFTVGAAAGLSAGFLFYQTLFWNVWRRQ